MVIYVPAATTLGTVLLNQAEFTGDLTTSPPAAATTLVPHERQRKRLHTLDETKDPRSLDARGPGTGPCVSIDRPMSKLPAGTVTFLFSDIEGSTRLLQRLGDAWGDVLADHRRLLRDAFTATDGREVDTQGDAFFVVFPRAGDAPSAPRRASAPSPVTTGPTGSSSAFAWGSTPASPPSARRATSASTSSAPPGSARPRTGGRCSSPRPHAPWSAPTTSSTSGHTGSRTSRASSASSSSSPPAFAPSFPRRGRSTSSQRSRRHPCRSSSRAGRRSTRGAP